MLTNSHDGAKGSTRGRQGRDNGKVGWVGQALCRPPNKIQLDTMAGSRSVQVVQARSFHSGYSLRAVPLPRHRQICMYCTVLTCGGWLNYTIATDLLMHENTDRVDTDRVL